MKNIELVVPKLEEYYYEQKLEEDPNTIKKKGRPRKYETKTVPVNIHLTWSAARAAKES